MKLLSVSVENFMGLFGNHTLALSGLGLTHIAGMNRDDPGNSSNGSGKSTLLEALTWCLFGEGLPRPQGNTERGVRADEVLNDRLNKQCKVTITLCDAVDVYEISRWRKWKPNSKSKQSKGVSLTVNGDVHESLDEDETNRLICETLGITHDIWCRGVVFGQESGFNFCDATAKSRQEILTTVMGLEKIDTWLDTCRDEKRALTNKMAELGGQVTALEGELERQQSHDWDSKVEEWQKQQEAKIQQAVIRKDEIAEYGKQLTASVNQIELPPFRERIQAPDTSVDTQDHANAVANEQRVQQIYNAVVAEQQRMQSLGTGVACPTCKQTITEQHQAQCAAELEQRGSIALDELTAAQGAVSKASEALNQIRADAAKKRQEWQVYEDARIQEERAHNEQKMRIASEEQKVASARREWKYQDQVITDLQAEVNPYIQMAADHAANLSESQSRLDQAKLKQEEVGLALDICLWWEKELPRFRIWLFDSVVDTLAAEANRWLGIMSGGVIWIQITTQKQVGKRLKDELDVIIRRWNPDGTITQRPYRVWSGGEKRRVALAVDLGLSRLMSQRASKAYSFIALDEIDRHLDDRGKDGLRQVLEELKQEKESILTITHDPAFAASFDNEIMIVKENGQPKMELVNVEVREEA